MSWTMRPATAEDHDQIRALFLEVFGYQRSAEHDRWLSFGSPDGHIIATVAVHRDKIVGFYGLLPTSLRLGGQRVLGAQSLDTMTHPDYRGQGMFTRLAIETYDLAAARGVKALYGFPNEASYPGFVRRLNWDHTGDVPRWTRILRPSGIRPMPEPLGRGLDVVAKLIGNRASPAVKRGRPEASELTRLIDECMDVRDICRVDRTPAWMMWRFATDSNRQYEWITAGDPHRLAAIAVWGIREDGHGVLSEIMGVDQHAVDAVVAGAVQSAYEASVPALHAVTNDPMSIAALKRSRFFARKPLPLIVRSMSHENLGCNIHFHEAWRVCGADIDTY